MSILKINGGNTLKGEVAVNGAKNAALPIMAAALLSTDASKLENLPLVDDVLTLKVVIESLGASLRMAKKSAIIDAAHLNNYRLPLGASQKMRASILVAAPLLSRFGKAIIPQPGGCVIGERPIDLHILGFQALGAKVERLDKDYLKIHAEKLRGNLINLPFPSMGATENLLMASCLAEGRTIINNAAREPEIVDLAEYLKAMGAQISGAGTPVIKIDGVKKLSPVSYEIMPDRIEAGTFMVMASFFENEIRIKNIISEHLFSLVKVLQEIGVHFSWDLEKKTAILARREKYKPTNVVTAPYPGFPTDLQPLLTPLLSLSDGVSVVTDTVFPKRFCYANQLQKMGAKISICDNSAIVTGIQHLSGADVIATDLRGGAGLIIAGLVAKDTTIIRNCSQIHRGYENIEKKLRDLGAEVDELSDDDLHLELLDKKPNILKPNQR